MHGRGSRDCGQPAGEGGTHVRRHSQGEAKTGMAEELARRIKEGAIPIIVMTRLPSGSIRYPRSKLAVPRNDQFAISARRCRRKSLDLMVDFDDRTQGVMPVQDDDRERSSSVAFCFRMMGDALRALHFRRMGLDCRSNFLRLHAVRISICRGVGRSQTKPAYELAI
jgi:hypothetical protein